MGAYGRTKWVLGSVIASAVFSCGDGGGTTEEVDAIQEAWGESACCALPPNVTLSPGQIVQSPDGLYGNSSCTNTYIVHGNAVAGERATAKYAGPIPTPSNFGCGSMWAKVALYRKTGTLGFGGAGGIGCGPAWEKVGEKVSFGTQSGSNCFAARAQVLVPQSGEYRIMSQSGLIFTYTPVRVGFGP
jgi:hypothetical protein